MADYNQQYYGGYQGEDYPEDEYYGEDQYPAYDASQDRPSFSSYWKSSKEKQKPSRGHKNIRFVQTTMPGTSTSYSSYGSGTDPDAGMSFNMASGYGASADSAREDEQIASSSTATQDKAQLRRAQVRKAQIQHRQRKANYVKQLEQDVAGLRDMITTEQQQVDMLRGENDYMRSHVQQPMGPHDPLSMMPMGNDLPVSLPPYSSDPTGSQSLDYYGSGYAIDDAMNRPAYGMSGPSSPDYYQSTSPPSLYGQDPIYGASSRVSSSLAPLPDLSDPSQQGSGYSLAPLPDNYSYPSSYRK